MKIATIIGARPQFIKAATISRAIAQHNQSGSTPAVEEITIHTGQHYDEGMSAVFFRELEMAKPTYNLEIGGHDAASCPPISSSHGWQTGRMLMAIEEVLLKEKPDWVLIYGDTNSTLAGALAAAKLHIRIVHVEAGLRSYNRLMPEEINRIVTDHLSTYLFCPSKTAVENLRREGIASPLTPDASRLTPNVFIVGDVMADALQFAATKASAHSDILARLGLQPQGYLLATVHRAENTDDSDRLGNIMAAFSELAEREPVILPLHPRTKKILDDNFSLRLTPHASPLTKNHRSCRLFRRHCLGKVVAAPSHRFRGHAERGLLAEGSLHHPAG